MHRNPFHSLFQSTTISWFIEATHCNQHISNPSVVTTNIAKCEAGHVFWRLHTSSKARQRISSRLSHPFEISICFFLLIVGKFNPCSCYTNVHELKGKSNGRFLYYEFVGWPFHVTCTLPLWLFTAILVVTSSSPSVNSLYYLAQCPSSTFRMKMLDGGCVRAKRVTQP